MESQQTAIAHARRAAQRSADAKWALLDNAADELWRAFTIIRDAFAAGHQLFACGNGGSAADAQHFVTELVVRLDAGSRRRPLPATSLATDTSIMTAASNDFGYDYIFARQIEARARKGDVLLLISTSGNSQNLIKAAQHAQKHGVSTIALLGKGGGQLAKAVNCAVVVPSDDTQRIQECHIFVLHQWCEWLEQPFSV